MVLLAGRYLVEERPHMLEYILLNFLTNWRQDFVWRSHSMQHVVKICKNIHVIYVSILELCTERILFLLARNIVQYYFNYVLHGSLAMEVI